MAAFFFLTVLIHDILNTTDLEEKQHRTAKHVKHFEPSFLSYVELFSALHKTGPQLFFTVQLQ